MEQRFIKGDELSFKEYLLNWNNPTRFRSIGKWFLFSTMETFVVTIPLLLIMCLFGFLAKTLPHNVADVLKFCAGITLFMLVLVWVVTFYNSFIAPILIKKRVNNFIRNYIPDADALVQSDTDIWFFRWKKNLYSLAYKENVSHIISNGRQVRKTVSRYYKISLAKTLADYHEWDVEVKETPLSEGISIVRTNVNIFARIERGKRYFQKDIADALDTLRKEDTMAFK